MIDCSVSLGDYMSARARDDHDAAWAAVAAITESLRKAPVEDATVRLIGLVMTVAERCASELPPAPWRALTRSYSAKIEALPPPSRRAVQLILAYAGDDEPMALDLMRDLVSTSTLRSLASELAATFACLISVHMHVVRSR